MKINTDSLSLAMQDLQSYGYTYDLNLRSNCVFCRDLKLEIQPTEFKIDKFFRFEGDSNPDDSSILFAISVPSYKIKGVLVDAYGIYADPLNAEMIQKLKYKP